MKTSAVKILVVQVLILLVTSGATGCADDETPEVNDETGPLGFYELIEKYGMEEAEKIPREEWPGTPADTRPDLINREIIADHVHHTFGSYIQFSGTSTFPGGTVLVSQLFEDDIPLSWWPNEREIIVNEGEWEIIVEKSADITASDLELRIGPGYDFNIWERDNPEIKGGLYFDLVGPSATK